ncbi:MFS transporter [Wohlfahrtiimonas larvae]|uniref:MFS transporter n=1 Tax=Wohlfahrtiimonas larvae TaxID=1157986 RepID=A0ABP9MMI9_9GAMM|nr:MFS transporter [Wohlfahrtiimonas larvae]
MSSIKRRDWFLLLSLGNFKITLVGFYMISIVTILKQSGFSLNQLSLLYLLASIELVQVLVSLVIERYQVNNKSGHFRFWLLLSNGIIFLALFALFWIDIKEQFNWLLVICFVLSIMGIFLASATLGLNSTILSYKERGFGGVVQVLSARSGRMIGGGLVLYLYQHYGWHIAVGLMLFLSFIMLVQIYFYREPSLQQSIQKKVVPWRDLLKRIWTYWLQPTTGWRWFILLILSCMPYAFTATTFIPVLSDQGFDAAQVGTILAVYLPILCMIASPISGWMMRHLSRYTMIFSILFSQVFVLASFIFVEELTKLYRNAFIVQIMVLSIGYTLLLPAVMAVFMDKAGKEMATLDSSLQYTVMMTGASIASFLSLRLASHFGFGWVYGLSAAVSLVMVIFILLFCQRIFIVNE